MQHRAVLIANLVSLLSMTPAVGCALPEGGGEGVAEAQSADSAGDGDHHGDGPGGPGDRRRATPVVFDTDMDFDDSAALAFLAAEHKLGRIDLRAVTVTNNGAGLPGRAIFHARCLLERFGLSSVPVADNRATGPEQFPAQVQGAAELVLNEMVDGCTQSDAPSTLTADQLLLQTVSRSDGPVTLVSTGPLTNIARALAAPGAHGCFGGSDFADHVDRIFIMAGAVHVAGNVPPSATEDGSQEFNAWGDAAATRAVLGAPFDVRLVALDASQFVPVTVAFSTRMQGDHHTPEADYVAALLANPLIAFGIQNNLGFFWWDPLDAVASDTSHIVTYEWDRIAVAQSGVQTGRTAAVSSGQPGSWVRVGIHADAQGFEDFFLDTLNGRTR